LPGKPVIGVAILSPPPADASQTEVPISTFV
jgi:hypothetical protein